MPSTAKAKREPVTPLPAANEDVAVSPVIEAAQPTAEPQETITCVRFSTPIRLDRQESEVGLHTHPGVKITMSSFGFVSVEWKKHSVLVPMSNIAFLKVERSVAQ